MSSLSGIASQPQNIATAKTAQPVVITPTTSPSQTGLQAGDKLERSSVWAGAAKGALLQGVGTGINSVALTHSVGSFFVGPSAVLGGAVGIVSGAAIGAVSSQLAEDKGQGTMIGVIGGAATGLVLGRLMTGSWGQGVAMALPSIISGGIAGYASAPSNPNQTPSVSSQSSSSGSSGEIFGDAWDPLNPLNQINPLSPFNPNSPIFGD